MLKVPSRHFFLIQAILLIADALYDHVCLQLVKQIDQQPLARHHAYTLKIPQRQARDLGTLRQCMRVFLLRIDHNGNHNLIIKRKRALDNVKVPQSHRIKATGHDSNTHISISLLAKIVICAAP